MEAKDLRYGNYVRRVRDGLICEVFNIHGPSGIVSVRDESGYCTYQERVDVDVEPISLIEIEPINVWGGSKINKVPDHINYVHQVQNLAFSLTGKEVGIKFKANIP